MNDIIIKGDIYTDPTFTVEIIQQSEQPVQPKNVADLLEGIDAMSFIKRGNYAIDPSFRGAMYDQLNVQYDGGVKAMHACPNRMDPVTTHILPEDIDKIELIKGPYSVRNGANFGGVVNLVTSKPGLDNEGLTGHAKAGFETNGGTYLLSSGLQYATDNFHIKGSAGYRDFGNYKDGNGTTVPSAFKSTDYVLGAGYSPTHQHHFMANWRQSFGRDVLHAALPMDTDIDDSSIASLDYYANHLSENLHQLGVKAYYSYVDHIMSNTLRPNFHMMSMVSHVEANTYGGKIEAHWKFGERLNLFTGTDMYNVNRSGTKVITRKRDMQGNMIENPVPMEGDIWQDALVHDIGFFAETGYELAENWVLKSGARVDWVNAETKKPDAAFEQIYGTNAKSGDVNISGHIGFKYSPDSRKILEFAIGRGVRSADMSERFINYFNIGQDLFTYVGNPNLKPEINHQFEIGFKNQTKFNDNGFMKLNYGISVYYALLHNYISAVINPELATPQSPNVKSFVNVDEAYKYGFELHSELDVTSNLSFGTSLAYIKAHNEDRDEPLPLIPPLTAKFNLLFENAKWHSDLQFKAVTTQKEIAVSFGETETPGYGVWDYEIVYKPVTNWSLGASVLNIFDKAYYNHQNFLFTNQADFGRTAVNDPGRNFTIFTRYTF